MPVRDFRATFEQFKQLRVMVIGDVMVDAYIFGRVDRISPEAPVPVVTVEKRVNRLGGAANVALNLKSLGAEPVLCSVIGNDIKGDEFIRLLGDEQISAGAIHTSVDRVTTTKFRVIGNKSQLLRVDEEITDDLNARDQSALLENVRLVLSGEKIDMIIFQDYNKGILSPEVISTVTRLAKEQNIPVAVDPKKKNFLHYKGVTLFKPNLKELREGMNRDIRVEDMAGLKEAAVRLHRENDILLVMITLAEHGVFISQPGEEGAFNQSVVPAHIRKISDVSGAGDTVISVAALGLAAGMEAETMAALANLAGGLVCEEVGVLPVNRAKLLAESEKLL